MKELFWLYSWASMSCMNYCGCWASIYFIYEGAILACSVIMEEIIKWLYPEFYYCLPQVKLYKNTKGLIYSMFSCKHPSSAGTCLFISGDNASKPELKYDLIKVNLTVYFRTSSSCWGLCLTWSFGSSRSIRSSRKLLPQKFLQGKSLRRARRSERKR